MRQRRIFESQIANPTPLSAHDQDFLDRHQLKEDFERLKEYASQNPEQMKKALRDKRILRWVGRALILAAAGAGTFPDQTHSLSDDYDLDNMDPLDGKDIPGMSRYDEKVELIFTSPIPHVSIRIGGTVFNYGQGEVQMWGLDDYNRVGFGSALSGSHTRVELKLTKEEAAKLRDRLHKDVGKRYPLIFPFNDCISMTVRALRESTGISVPYGLDRSQSYTIAYFRSLKAGGSVRVGKITYAGTDGSVFMTKTADFGMNLLDGTYFLQSGKTLLWSVPLIEGYSKYGEITW